MTHLVYTGNGNWYRATKPWSNDTFLEGPIEPVDGDTFTDFTSRNDAPLRLPVGLKAVTTRTAVWGENDYRIENVNA